MLVTQTGRLQRTECVFLLPEVESAAVCTSADHILGSNIVTTKETSVSQSVRITDTPLVHLFSLEKFNKHIPR